MIVKNKLVVKVNLVLGRFVGKVLLYIKEVDDAIRNQMCKLVHQV